ncbi:MAG: aspartate-semialdehyde dehydrogenase [Microcystis sp. M048S1]|uniref:aspartate-semialdehyde dehydrogenase n=1 Tax=unclassified Microcystis TaxID=2643300 RepID=UPI0011906DD4|nr:MULTISPECIES: aspartate-semialdehyde dehydrogenase [unclassified Microcystis]MCA2902902.1 aspartate-semialdehyde dehydrogenase [Microcystis sp. M035S1]MCA2720368.1 aspartate-semialdehyde dehydrogenase [Microcystis sp. M176S2]MCA2724952.1 aspartate-semialdehyde dehydrogenase [Microcystis sp. M166S2]MCA2731889.1 aspartate-semialdehyde dehydrogenase [Microcystis sp. M162S2]MCA2747987.1 aspartate-semialdehyde dehydrogenase [Microcystis sp. M155S2]
MSQKVRVAILGATGAVGTELLELLASRQFPLASLKLLASERSAGKTLDFRCESLLIEAVNERSFQDVDIVLASAGGSTSKAWAKTIVESGATMIDNSSAFRMNPEVPLVVPEINPDSVDNHRGIIANPNCTTILLGVAIWPLHQVQAIERVVVSTYQSASGAGARAMEEVKEQARAILEHRQPPTNSFPYPLAFNLFPHNTPINGQGYCEEEMKMVNETRKIFACPGLRVSATCVRVPVLRAHSESVNLEFSQPFSVVKAREILQSAPGVKLVEDWDANYFPMPIDATGRDEVLVGRIRQDISHPNGLELWLCGDQIRKGAALNAVQIAELLVKKNLVGSRLATV